MDTFGIFYIIVLYTGISGLLLFIAHDNNSFTDKKRSVRLLAFYGAIFWPLVFIGAAVWGIVKFHTRNEED